MEYKIRVKHDETQSDYSISINKDTLYCVLDFLNDKGFSITAPCGSSGICGKCKVILKKGKLKKISDGSLVSGEVTVKSCQYALTDGTDCEIEIPHQLDKKDSSSRNHLTGAVFEFVLKNVKLSHISNKFGIAIDIGTTNISVLLANLADGKILAVKNIINSQIAFASDVISRINLCLKDKDAVAKLQRCVIEKSILPAIDYILKDNNILPDDIERIAISGNTTMLHLLCGKTPSSIGTYPFKPLFLEAITTTFDKLTAKFEDNPSIKAKTILLPGISAFVGSDILSGIYALDMHETRQNEILLDIGTNGEIALKTQTRILTTSTAAGPVFEGFGLECGVTAIDGAINEITFDAEKPIIKTVNNSAPIGICGSGYISFIANAKKAGLIDSLGKFNGVKEIVLQNSSISISESDISKILQAKSAIASGIQILLNNANITESEIDKLYLAGSFGTNLKKDYVINSGLLKNFHPSQIECVGNTSLAGAYKYIVSLTQLSELENISQNSISVNLNEDPAFCDIYVDNLFLP